MMEDDLNLLIRVKRKREEDEMEEILVDGPDRKKRKIATVMEDLSLEDTPEKEFMVFTKIEIDEDSSLFRNYLKQTHSYRQVRKTLVDRKERRINKKRLLHVNESRVFGGNDKEFCIIDFETWMARDVFPTNEKNDEPNVEYHYYQYTGKKKKLTREEYETRANIVYIHRDYNEEIEEEMRSDDEDENSDNFLKCSYPYTENKEGCQKGIEKQLKMDDFKSEIEDEIHNRKKPPRTKAAVFRAYSKLKAKTLGVEYREEDVVDEDEMDEDDEGDLNEFIKMVERRSENEMDVDKDDDSKDSEKMVLD